MRASVILRSVKKLLHRFGLLEETVLRHIHTRPIPTWIYFFVFTWASIQIWKDPTQPIQERLLWALCILSLPHLHKAWELWKQPSGRLFIFIFIYSLLILPWSTSPKASWQDAKRAMDILAMAFCIPALWSTPRKLEHALLYTAAAFTGLIGYDLVRLSLQLKTRLLADAHTFEPFFIIHSNISGMISGAGALLWIYFLLRWRKERRSIGAAVALLIHLAYCVIIASRGMQVALMGALSLLAFVLLPGGRKKGLLLAICLPAAILLLFWMNPRFTEPPALKNLAGRGPVWQHVTHLSWQRPFIGYGFGEQVFLKVYHSSQPPEAPFHYWHPHNYWLFVLFAQGWIGVILHLYAWSLLVRRAFRFLSHSPSFDCRLQASVLFSMIAFIFIFGLADWPSAHIHILLLWLIPCALVSTSLRVD